jgi:hypothetical protein
MPIQIDCKCGRRLKVADEHAGKRVRCPACKTTLAVPEEEPIECDVLDEPEEGIQEEPRRPPAKAKRREEDEPEVPRKGKKKTLAAPDEEEPIECDVLDEEEPRRAPAKAKRRERDDDDEEDRPRRGKKKRRRRSEDREGDLSRQYMAEARKNMRRDEMRARAAGGFERDEDGGWTMFGVHITAGVLSGAGMLFVGLLAMVIIFIIRSMDEDIIPGPRLFIAAIVFTTIGGITLIKSIFYGEED